MQSLSLSANYRESNVVKLPASPATEFEEGVTAGTAAAVAMIADNSSDDQRHRCEWCKSFFVERPCQYDPMGPSYWICKCWSSVGFIRQESNQKLFQKA